MPPKPIVDQEAVLNAAISILRRQGIQAINARSLAAELGCSTKPLFRLYKNMDELKSEVRFRINKICSEALTHDLDLSQEDVELALRYVRFAETEPFMFQALFMHSSLTASTLANMVRDEEIIPLLDRIAQRAEITREAAKPIYLKMWLLAHGMASIATVSAGTFKSKETIQILTEAMDSFINAAKSNAKEPQAA